VKEIADRLAAYARESGEFLLRLQGKVTRGDLKEPGALVTRADRASHEVLRAAFERDFRGTPIVMEEQSNPDVLPDTYLLADELDGTSLYASGLDDWGITLAYVERGVPVAGVLHQPVRNRTVIAWRGGGAWLGDRRIRVESRLPLRERIALIAFNRWSTDAEVAWMRRVAGLALAARGLACTVASSIELLSGHAALYLNPRGGKVWDFAAAALAVEEAGGATRSSTGDTLMWNSVPMGILFAASDGIAREVLGTFSQPLRSQE